MLVNVNRLYILFSLGMFYNVYRFLIPSLTLVELSRGLLSSCLRRKRENRGETGKNGKIGKYRENSGENCILGQVNAHGCLAMCKQVSSMLFQNFLVTCIGEPLFNFLFFKDNPGHNCLSTPSPQYQCWWCSRRDFRNSPPTLILGGEGGLGGGKGLLDTSLDHDCLIFLKKKLSLRRDSDPEWCLRWAVVCFDWNFYF